MPVASTKRPIDPTPAGLEFQRLSQGLRTAELRRILGVSDEMISRYRYYGAPTARMAALRQYVLDRAREALSSAL